ncbi:TolC family protein [Fulvivirga sp. RKSG066]|uniref:TolC family protein n=1 Tax=Fulvivirga aurantia TaxID=2529383 RepID=UPI0012BD3416|nr:TolC family protein [Fulvivirga aurantia]MTI21235.1 TolC family protein [Fulvivirga aurantia]
MSNKFFLSVCFVIVATTMTVNAQKAQFSLGEIIDRAVQQSPAAKQAETRKENRYWQYRFYKSNYNPQLRLSGSAPGYAKAFDRVQQPDGTFGFVPVNQLNSQVNLGLEQPIPFTGGNVSINSNLFYFDVLGDDIENQIYRGSPINISLSQPVFAFNQLRWDKRTEPLRFEESKREFVEEKEAISRQAVDLFFSYLVAQINLQIAEFNLANNDTIYKIEEGRYNIGTTSRNNLLQVELQLLRSKQGVAQAKLDLETSQLQLRSFIGLNDETPFQLRLPESIPQFEINYGEALEYAKSNRADFLAFERRRIEAEREVARAKGQRFQTNITATVGWNDSGDELNDVYNDPLNEQRANISFSIPIMDWGRNKARMQTALANERLSDYVIAQDELNFEQEILTQVRQFEVLRSQLEITKKSDEVAQERYMVSQNRYLIGKIDITNLNIALTEKDDAKRSYINALKSFWTAYYDLRRLTLYDFANEKLLYTPEEK